MLNQKKKKQLKLYRNLRWFIIKKFRKVEKSMLNLLLVGILKKITKSIAKSKRNWKSTVFNRVCKSVYSKYYFSNIYQKL